MKHDSLLINRLSPLALLFTVICICALSFISCNPNESQNTIQKEATQKFWVAMQVKFSSQLNASQRDSATKCIQTIIRDSLNAIVIAGACEQIEPNLITVEGFGPDSLRRVFAVPYSGPETDVCSPCTCANHCKICLKIQSLNCLSIPGGVDSVYDKVITSLNGIMLKN